MQKAKVVKTKAEFITLLTVCTLSLVLKCFFSGKITATFQKQFLKKIFLKSSAFILKRFISHITFFQRAVALHFDFLEYSNVWHKFVITDRSPTKKSEKPPLSFLKSEKIAFGFESCFDLQSSKNEISKNLPTFRNLQQTAILTQERSDFILKSDFRDMYFDNWFELVLLKFCSVIKILQCIKPSGHCWAAPFTSNWSC